MSDVASVVSPDASGLAETVERARALLDDGDVIAARMLASGAYDQAKAAAGYAERFNAGRQLVDKARRLQGDALLIEARANVRLADEFDAAQAAGVVRKKGQRGTDISDENNSNAVKPASLEETGLTAAAVHLARKLRDAERRTPGIVERAIAARLAAGLEPSRANLRAAVGTDSATRAERGNNLYETPRVAMETLLSFMRFSKQVLEPACGKGAISSVLEEAGYEVCLSDLVDYGTAGRDGVVQEVGDFLATTRTDRGIEGDWSGALTLPAGIDIVTNPPYGADLNRFVAHALRVHRPRRMALLLNLNFLCGFDDPDRNFVMDENPPAKVLVFSRRLPMMHRDGWDGPEAASRMNTAWFIWELRPLADGDMATGADGLTTAGSPAGYAGSSEFIRVDWKVFEGKALPGPADEAGGDGGPSAPPARKRRKASGEPTGPNREMPALSWHQAFEGGRILAKAGAIEVGAVFPGHPDPDRDVSWSYWLTGGIAGASGHKDARSIDAAKAALEKRWRQFLGEAGFAPLAADGGEERPAKGREGAPKRATAATNARSPSEGQDRPPARKKGKVPA